MAFQRRSVRGRLTLAFVLLAASALVVGAAWVTYDVNRALRHDVEAARRDVADHVRVALLVAGPLMLALLGAAAWMVVTAALRPVRHLADAARALAPEDAGQRLPEATGDREVAELAATLNGLLDRVRESLQTQRQFLDDASHELRTPLTVLRGELDLALLELNGAQPPDLAGLRHNIRVARDEADRLGRLADDLLLLARAEQHQLPLRLVAVNLRDVAEAVASRFPGWPTVSVHGPAVLVNADRDRVVQVVTNLVANATRFARNHVSVDIEDAEGAGGVLRVADDGPGFPQRMLPRATLRFSRASSSRTRGATEAGVGLGLAIAEALVRAHGGHVEVGNGPPLGGATVAVHLPLGPGH